MALSDWTINTTNHFDVEEVGSLDTIQGSNSLRLRSLSGQTENPAPKSATVSLDRSSEYAPRGIVNGRMRCLFRRDTITTSELNAYAGFYFLSNTDDLGSPDELNNHHYYKVCNRASGITVRYKAPGKQKMSSILGRHKHLHYNLNI